MLTVGSLRQMIADLPSETPVCPRFADSACVSDLDPSIALIGFDVRPLEDGSGEFLAVLVDFADESDDERADSDLFDEDDE